MCANVYSHTSWTAVCTLGVCQSCDLQFCTHVCSYTSWTAPYNTHTYVYEIMLYIPTCLGQLCKHAQTHMYIIYKIMSVCYRAPSETCGNTHVYKTVSCKSHD